MPEKDRLDPLVFPFVFTEGLYQEVQYPADAAPEDPNGVLIITQNVPTAEEAGLLESILRAVNIDLAEATQVTLHSHSNTVSEIIVSSSAGRVVLFGIDFQEAANYTPIKLAERVVLKADSLDKLITETDKKRLLWKALQNMFL